MGLGEALRLVDGAGLCLRRAEVALAAGSQVPGGGARKDRALQEDEQRERGAARPGARADGFAGSPNQAHIRVPALKKSVDFPSVSINQRHPQTAICRLPRLASRLALCPAITHLRPDPRQFALRARVARL